MCLSCKRAFSYSGTIPVFLDAEAISSATAAEQSDSENVLKNFFKRWPHVYEWVVHTLTPVLFSGLTVKKFLARFPKDSVLKMVNVGSGQLRLHPNVINVDLFKFPNVDLLADATFLPFADGTFDVTCSEQVIEHVEDPYKMASELMRITKPGGLIYIGAPFMYPLHPSPRDYTRWTYDGYFSLLQSCEVVEKGIIAGPTSGMLSILAAWLALIFSFGLKTVQKILHYFFMVVLCPFKILDYLFVHFSGADAIACTLYVIVRKPVGGSDTFL
jgi:SAM-dependent methyltransferase